MALKLSHKAYILISVPLIFEICFISALITIHGKINQTFSQQTRLKEMLSLINSQIKSLPQSATQLGFYGLRKEEHFLRQFHQTIATIEQNTTRLGELATPGDKDLVDKFNTLVKKILAQLTDTEMHLSSSNQYELINHLSSLQFLMREATETSDALVKMKQESIDHARELEENLEKTVNILVLVGVAISILLSATLAYSFHTVIAQKLALFKQNAFLLASGLPLNPVTTGGDELSDLDKSFHEMAAALMFMREKEAALLDNATEIICSLDRDFRFLNANRAVNTILGYEVDELIKTSLISLADGGAAECLRKIESAITTNGVKSFEISIRRKDGLIRDLVWATSWNDKEQAFFAVAHDVTEQNKIDAMKKQMVAMISHDLRAPLTSLQLSFELLEKGKLGELNERGKNKASQGVRVIRRLNSLINAFLDVEKLESGEVELRYSEVPLAQLIQRSVDSVQNLAERKGLIFQITSGEESIICDVDKMTDVLTNLLHNAIKFSPNDSIVAISAAVTEQIIEFTVCDRGKGVPMNKRELIFEKFKQADPSGETEAQGTGLGLAIAKGIVTAHGGTIGVKSSDDWSSIFWIRLPIKHQL